MHVCDICEEEDCINCYNGNPCLSCTDYDTINNGCTSNGACFEKSNQLDKGVTMVKKEISLEELADKIVDFARSASDETLLVMMYAMINELMDRKVEQQWEKGR